LRYKAIRSAEGAKCNSQGRSVAKPLDGVEKEDPALKGDMLLRKFHFALQRFPSVFAATVLGR
jgi:hypothetical protein